MASRSASRRVRADAGDGLPVTRTVPTKPSTRRAVKLDENTHGALVEKVIRGELSSQQVEDPFRQFYATMQGDLNIAEPPVSLPGLMRLVQENAMLRQCIEAMVTNVEAHGYRMIYIGDEGQEQSEPAKKELEALEGFFDAPNDSYSLIEMRSRLRWDLEVMGNAYIEVARNVKGEITAAWHIPAHLMRLTHVDRDPTNVKALLPRKTGPVEQTIRKHFRRFVQMVGTRRIYFKEFGDPRPINPANGQPFTEAFSHEDTATEIIHLKIYSPGTAYGLPRWITQRPSILGSRQAELTNLEYFTDNAIPAMVILVSGGTVDQPTIDAIEEHIQSARGRKAQNRVVVVSATGDEHAAAENGTIAPPKLEIKPLRGEADHDGKFMEYEKACHAKVRSAFRLPPIFVGQSEDYTHATAKASFEVAESQVFGPERSQMDDIVNRKLLSTWGVKYWQFRSNPPRIADPEEMLEAIKTFEASGAMTPNIVIGVANEMFDLDIPLIDDEWGNWPFEMVKALGTAGRIKGMDSFVEKLDPPPGLEGNVPGQPAKPGEKPKPKNGKEGEEPTPFKNKKEEAHHIVRSALLDLRNAISQPATAYVEVAREDGTVHKVRHRARG